MENNIQYTTEPEHLTAYEFHYNTPSRRDNMTYVQENFQRAKGVQFMERLSTTPNLSMYPFTRYSLFPKTISAAAIFIAAKSSDIPLNDNPSVGTCWFEFAKVEDINIVAAAVDYILQSYTTGPVVKKSGCSQDPNCPNNPLHFACTEIVHIGRTQVLTPPDT
ncbi:16866_t:CDS:2 [Racocetra persica]|uniref:16866_t:CDS:1 n=1 Tax=Racocetra persica TaxID=160502 RepID=A0ACA9KIU1_9GLOM|nr:16866_t:CDS:2 [Racocetra persica]